jgi:hypothetical protein
LLPVYGVWLITHCSYVLLAATSTFFVNTYHMVLTVKYRKKSGVKYPACYASNEVAEKDKNAYLLNCGKTNLVLVGSSAKE